MTNINGIIDFKNNVYILCLFEIHFLHLFVSSLLLYIVLYTVLNCFGVNIKPFAISLDVFTSRRNVLAPSVAIFRNVANSPVVSL